MTVRPSHLGVLPGKIHTQKAMGCRCLLVLSHNTLLDEPSQPSAGCCIIIIMSWRNNRFRIQLVICWTRKSGCHMCSLSVIPHVPMRPLGSVPAHHMWISCSRCWGAQDSLRRPSPRGTMRCWRQRGCFPWFRLLSGDHLCRF